MTFRVLSKACPVIACFALAFAGCSDDDDDDGGFVATSQGRMEVHATDAPPQFSTLREVTLRILRVDAIGAVNTGSANQAVTLFTAAPGQEREIDLLPLKGGRTEQLAAGPVPAGTYDRIRLFITGGAVRTQSADATQPTTFSTENGLLTVTGGTQQQDVRVFDVDLPGDGVVVSANETERVIIDFDLQESLEATGDPNAPTAITVDPVIRGRTLGTGSAAQGTIRGVIRSNQGTTTTADDAPLQNVPVVVRRDSQLVAVTRTDPQGVFVLEGIEPGNYVLVVEEQGFVSQQNEVQTQQGQTFTSDVLLVQQTNAN